MRGVETAQQLPGPDTSDPVLLVGDPGFSAEIALDSWLLRNAEATVRRGVPTGEWPGVVKRFTAARYSVATWRLASGKQREWAFFSDPKDGYVPGRTFEISQGSHRWTATVTESGPAIRVSIEYTIQSGAKRRRDFFRRGELQFFGELTPDGQVGVYRSDSA